MSMFRRNIIARKEVLKNAYSVEQDNTAESTTKTTLTNN